MLNRRKALTVIVLASILIVTGGWGFLAHKTIHQLAVYELPEPMQSFFYKNIDYLIYNSVTPDLRRKKVSAEAPKHFIDLELYGDSAAWKMPVSRSAALQKYSKNLLLKNGYLPYHIVAMHVKLTGAFKSKNADSILFYAAEIGHYIGDAHVPLHTSVNYDGKQTNQKGLHALWETVVPEIEIANYTLTTKHRATYLRSPETEIWNAIRRSHSLLAEVFLKEKQVTKLFKDSAKYRIQIRNGKETRYYTTAFAKAYNKALHPTINRQLILSANMVADFWYTAWVNAGKPELKKLLLNWNDRDKKNLDIELESFKQNKLVKDRLLRSLKKAKAPNVKTF